MGKLQAFEIQCEANNRHAVFSAGHNVVGQVLVELSEPMKMRNIRLRFHGRGKVNWRVHKGSGNRRRTVHYRSEENYFDQTFILFGSEANEGVMHPAGTHTYTFDFPLPINLPSSFEGEYGYVRYQCMATIDKPWKFDHETTKAFTVLSHLDLNQEPVELHSAMMGKDTTEVSCCCCVSGNVHAEFRIDRRGYVPGETILINATVFNDSNTSVTSTRVALKQYIEFFGASDAFFSAGNMKSKCVSDVIVTKQRFEIPAGETEEWKNVALEIPSLPPSRLVGCEIISVAYVIKFYVSVSYGTDLKVASDIVIGTVPLVYGAAAPSAVNLDMQPSAPPPDMPPPSYEEYSKGTVNLEEERDSRYTWGKTDWAPVYPIYRQQSVTAS